MSARDAQCAVTAHGTSVRADVAVFGFLSTGSVAAAQNADERFPRLLRNASAVLRPFVASTVLLCLACPAIAAANEEPDCRRIRSALERPTTSSRLAVTVASVSAIRPARSQSVVKSGRRDSVWEGLLIGAGIGAPSGYLWGRGLCGSNDSECLTIAGTVGVLGGTAIGATIGAIIDALHN